MTAGLAIARKAGAENKEDERGERRSNEEDEEIVAESITVIGNSAAGGSLAATTSTKKGGASRLKKRNGDIVGGVRLNLTVNEEGYVGDVLDDKGALITCYVN